MALRSVLRKMPALGLRSPPMGPLMGPVRALSPAASSWLMSSRGALGAQTIQPEGTLAEQLESIKLKRAELDRKWAENDRRTTAEFEKSTEMIRQEAVAGDAHYNELTRPSSEELSRFMKKLEIVGKTCTVLNAAFPAAAILLTINLNM